MTPLVSVMIPCYNATKTLPLALASLFAQTYKNWECIIVDDGSKDHLIDLVKSVNDNRIRFYRFEKNYGRAIARQQALDMACGEYLCMIDADDWIYPWKIERQIQVMETNPNLAVLSTGMAIVDNQYNLVATRSTGQNLEYLRIYPTLSQPKFPPIAHAPSIIRMSIAKQHNYNQKFRFTEDSDFLLKIILQHSYGIISDLTYVYSEIESVNLQKILESQKYGRQMFQQYKEVNPLYVYKNNTVIYIKGLAYFVGFNLGFGKYILERRSQKPTKEQIETFMNARQIVYNNGAKMFVNTPYKNMFEHQTFDK